MDSTLTGGDGQQRSQPMHGGFSADQYTNQDDGTIRIVSPPSAMLPSECHEESELRCVLLTPTTFYESRSAKQLLGSLVQLALTLSDQDIVLQLQDTHVRDSAVSNFDSTGKAVSTSVSRVAYDLWSSLKRINVPESNTTEVFGQVIQIHSLPAAVVLCLLVCLGKQFNLDRLFSILTRARQSSAHHAPISNLYSGEETWFFSMKYYYIGHDEPVYSDQTSGLFHEKEPSLRIFRGTAIVALRFVPNNEYNKDPSSFLGVPWKLLILSSGGTPNPAYQTFPNGVEAFLWGINAELSHVRRSLRRFAERIASTAVPSDDFLFDQKLQESLLFEDEAYTNSKTYFWALQSLRIVNESITSLITTWRLYNNGVISHLIRESQACQGDSVAGPTSIGPTVSGAIARIKDYVSKIEEQMTHLNEIIEVNNAKQEEIRALRDGLFNASAVLEARTTVTQGNNIRVLTLISLIFLPASFSTSIFSMPILPDSTTIHTFAIAMTVICGATYALILLLDVFGKGRVKSKKKASNPSRRLEKVRSSWARPNRGRGMMDVENRQELAGKPVNWKSGK